MRPSSNLYATKKEFNLEIAENTELRENRSGY
jgi:hypothetical protein